MENQVSQTVNSEPSTVSGANPEPQQIQSAIQQTNPKQSNFLVTLLSVLLLISVVIAGFFAYQTQNLVKELRMMNEETSVKPTPMVTDEPTASDNAMMDNSMSDWKTYLNSGALYEIKYPNGWRVVESSTMIGFGPQDIGEDVKWTINTYKKDEFTQEMIKSDIGKQFSDRKQVAKNISVNGTQATLVVTTTESVPSWYSESIIISYGSTYIVISNGAIKDPTFENFYSTFKFTN